MFTPRWKKEAKAILKNGKKFLNYKRDLLKEDRIAEIESRIRDLKESISSKSKEKTAEAIRQLENTCQKSLPRHAKKDPIGEQLESIFVALVIAIGIRSYYVQPFRIPTGSMQPTLNGVVAEKALKKEWPALPLRAVDLVLKGRGYVYKELKRDRVINFNQPVLFQNQGIWKPLQVFHTVAHIRFEDGLVSIHGLPVSELAPNQNAVFSLSETALKHGRNMGGGRFLIPKGTVICSGYADSGDLILADKVSYHFRKPKRGEVIIFDTRGIDTSGGSSSRNSSSLSAQMSATHYIKRCVGIPNDTLEIEQPNLIVNGKVAEEKYIQRVANAQGDYAPGYQIVMQGSSYRNAPLVKSGQKFSLNDYGKQFWLNEYAAMGDNTGNSLDSRYWGAYRSYNIVGTGFISLWPITSGHWGIIK